MQEAVSLLQNDIPTMRIDVETPAPETVRIIGCAMAVLVPLLGDPANCRAVGALGAAEALVAFTSDSWGADVARVANMALSRLRRAVRMASRSSNVSVLSA